MFTSKHVKLSSYLSLGLMTLLLVGTVAAQEAVKEKLPKGEEVMDQFVKATGGKAAYQNLRNRVTRGNLELVGQGLKLSMTIYSAPPGNMYTLLESEALGQIENGCNGEVVWEKNLMTGPRIKEGVERDLALRGATFDAVTNWRKLYKQAECVGVETIADQPCYKVVLTPTEGEPETRYFNQTSHLLVKTEMKLNLPMGVIPMEIYASDYKSVDGVLIAHQARVIVMGGERLMKTESVEHNVKMPKDRFELPAEIKDLLKQQKTQDAEKAKEKKPPTSQP